MATISKAKDLLPFVAAPETADDPVALLEQAIEARNHRLARWREACFRSRGATGL